MKNRCLTLVFLLISVAANAQPETAVVPLKVAMVQATPVWGDVEKNLENYANRIKECIGSDLIVLPEFFTTGAQMNKKSREESIAEKEYAAFYYLLVVETMQEWAAQTQALVMGSTVYAGDGKFFNRLIVAYPNGRVRYYDKANPFKKGLYSAGNEQLIIDYKGHKIATYICYDLRFAEWSRNTTGYDIAVYVANWPESRHNDWETLLCERAVENNATVIGVNCTGEDPFGLKYAGESVVVNPKGEVVKRAAKSTDQTIFVELE